MHERKLTPEYIVGLVDGEGSFSVFIGKAEKSVSRKRRVRAEPRFCIKLAEDDKEILHLVKDFFGCGKVYVQKDARKNHRQCYRYEVFNRSELRDIIIPFFRNNPPKFPSKRRDFSVFSEIMERMDKGEHLTDEGLAFLRRLKERMHASSPYAGNPHVRWERHC